MIVVVRLIVWSGGGQIDSGGQVDCDGQVVVRLIVVVRWWSS